MLITPDNTTLTYKPQACRWQTYRSMDELVQAALQTTLLAAHQAISQRGAFHLVLAGGSSPRLLYQALCYANVNWLAWHIYIGDERCLPPDNVERNSLMAKLAWLDHVTIPTEQIHLIPSELGSEIAASRYTQTLAGIDFFDLVQLGLGEDGHTASLFPHQDWGNTTTAPAAIPVHNAPKLPPERVSLSAHRLSATRQLMFLVTGEGKRQAIKDWRNGINIPASAIAPACGVDVFIEAGLLEEIDER